MRAAPIMSVSDLEAARLVVARCKRGSTRICGKQRALEITASGSSASARRCVAAARAGVVAAMTEGSGSAVVVVVGVGAVVVGLPLSRFGPVSGESSRRSRSRRPSQAGEAVLPPLPPGTFGHSEEHAVGGDDTGPMAVVVDAGTVPASMVASTVASAVIAALWRAVLFGVSDDIAEVLEARGEVSKVIRTFACRAADAWLKQLVNEPRELSDVESKRACR